jgi:inosose dehydratase
MPDIKWGYSINGFSLRRASNRERALKAISVCGFRNVELRHGSAPSAVMGRPDAIQYGYGTVYNFVGFLHSCGIDQIASFFFNPELPATEEEAQDWPGSPTDATRHEAIIESARTFAMLLHDVGGTCLVVRTIGREASPVSDAKMKTVAECWNKVGKMTKEYGVQTALHFDWQGAMRSQGDIDKMMALASPDVGLAIDTGEMMVCGVDPLALYEKYAARVKHFHFKDALGAGIPQGGGAPQGGGGGFPGGGGGGPRIFLEMGEGKVNFPALLKSIKQHNYGGWIIVENEGGSSQQDSCMMNSWYLKAVLSKV